MLKSLRRFVVPAVLLLFLAIACEDAGAETMSNETSAAWNTPAGAEYAAHVMNVSPEQAATDLAVQHEAFHGISELIEAGYHVWFDNQNATIHVYGTTAPASVPASVAQHVVYDDSIPSTSGNASPVYAASCGTSRETEEYCSPAQPGGRIEHDSGGYNGYCTAGFFVRDYSNYPYLLTAAHCAIYGTTFFENAFTSKLWPSLKRCELGSPVMGVSPWSGLDVALMPIVSSTCEGAIPYIHNWETGINTHQEGATNTQYKGEYVCHWGLSTKSLHACGTIFELDVPTKINYADSGSGEWTIQETDRVCGYAHPGDSGGPVTDGTYTGDATGLLLGYGTYGGCPNNGAEFIEQRIFAALNAFHVYIASS